MNKPIQIFTAADFVGLTAHGLTYEDARIAATRANEILNERGKRVYRNKTDKRMWWVTNFNEGDPKEIDTHEAVLVGEQEIEK